MSTEDAPPQRRFSDDAAAAALTAVTASGPYLPWGAGSLRVGGLVAVLNDVVLASRRCVLEIGSGTSTVLLARVLRSRWPQGGHRQVAVEHDAFWAQWVTDQLEREGLSAGTTVLHVPLAEHPHALDGRLWYDADRLEAGLDEALGDQQVDLLLVDGPPADTAATALSRYPALPALSSRLAAGATVVLDDVERPGEQDVLLRWEREQAVLFERRPDAGVALGRTGAASA
jgi:predicted O-methyltransferase YrrM